MDIGLQGVDLGVICLVAATGVCSMGMAKNSGLLCALGLVVYRSMSIDGKQLKSFDGLDVMRTSIHVSVSAFSKPPSWRIQGTRSVQFQISLAVSCAGFLPLSGRASRKHRFSVCVPKPKRME